MAHVISKEACLTEYVSIGVKQHERAHLNFIFRSSMRVTGVFAVQQT